MRIFVGGLLRNTFVPHIYNKNNEDYHQVAVYHSQKFMTYISVKVNSVILIYNLNKRSLLEMFSFRNTCFSLLLIGIYYIALFRAFLAHLY